MKMQHQEYNLTWPTYSDHLSNMMKEMMTSWDFADDLEHTEIFWQIVVLSSKTFCILRTVISFTSNISTSRAAPSQLKTNYIIFHIDSFIWLVVWPM